jgi:type II secretory pathway component PulM
MFSTMRTKLIYYWKGLIPRERAIISFTVLALSLLLFYMFLWKPWHHAINNMNKSVSLKRTNLVWMQQQAELIKSGAVAPQTQLKGESQSLLAVVEQTAKIAGVSSSIQQMVPRESNQVSVALEAVSFNKWIKWVGSLDQAYGVKIRQMSAEREDDEADVAEVRVTFER